MPSSPRPPALYADLPISLISLSALLSFFLSIAVKIPRFNALRCEDVHGTGSRPPASRLLAFLFFTFVTDVVGSHRFLFSFCFLRVRACARSLLLGPAPSWCGSVSASSLYSSLSLVSSRKSTHLIAIPTFYWRYTEDPLSYRHSLSPPTATALSSLI